VIIISVGRFIEAHLITSCFRAVATKVPAEHRETAARALGLLDQCGTTMGTIISTALVTSIAQCSSR
jgi:hypothetical protein